MNNMSNIRNGNSALSPAAANNPVTAQVDTEVRAIEARQASAPPAAPSPPSPPASPPVDTSQQSDVPPWYTAMRLAQQDGVVDVAEMMDLITATLDPAKLLEGLMKGDGAFLENLAKAPAMMDRVKETLRQVNLAKEAFTGVLDSVGERRKKLAEGLGRV